MMGLQMLVPVLGLLVAHAEARSDAQRKTPAVDDRAPAITLTGLLQAPEEAPAAEELSWEYFKERGEIVILEFWATWCGPCIGAIPHLNRLAEEFKDKPIVFLSVTDEDDATIRPFLEQRTMKSWVGLDTNRSMRRAYGVRGIPHTVLVDREGRIAGVTHPNALTAEVIENVLAGKPSGLPERTSSMERVPIEDDQTPPILDIRIRPLEEHPGWGQSSSGPGRMEQSAINVRGLIMYAHGFFDSYRVDAPEDLPDEWYSVVITYPAEQKEEFGALLKQVVRTAFGVEARRELREADVMVLTAPHGPGPGLVEAASQASGASARSGEWTAIGQPVTSVAQQLQNAVRQTVIDETGLTGRFDFELRWDPEDPQSLVRVVQEELGLLLEPGRREVEFLVVERIGE